MEVKGEVVLGGGVEWQKQKGGSIGGLGRGGKGSGGDGVGRG